MNVKSLLLGSAAALLAVSGARAADAVVVAEPEPMEYVRVCDTYGAGFYYIPGTETCLKIGGLVRYTVDYSQSDRTLVPTTTVTPASLTLYPEEDFATFAETYGPAWAFLDEAPWTDLQTLSNWTFGPGTGPNLWNVGYLYTPETTTTTWARRADRLDDGWAKAVYVRVNIDARSETEWGTFQRFIRLSGTVEGGDDTDNFEIEYAYISIGGFLVGLYDTLYDADLYADFDRQGGDSVHQIRYTWNGANGVQVALSVEENDYDLDYTPNGVLNIGIAQGWGGVRGWVAYDATAEEFAVKAMAEFKATDAVSLEAIATYESGSSMYSTFNGGYEWTIAGNVVVAATDKLTLSAGGQYFADRHATGGDDWAVGGQVDFKPVQNLLFRGRVRYTDGDSYAKGYIDAQGRMEAAF